MTSNSRLGRNPLQKKKASATEKILSEDFVRAETPASAHRAESSGAPETSPHGLVDRLSRMDIRLDIQGILRHFTK